MPTSSPSFFVRSYAPADEQSWVRCRALSFLSTQYFDDVKPRRTRLADESIALVALQTTSHGDEVIGILDIEIEGELATIDTVATHPDHARRSIATALLEAALPQLRNRGVGTLDAWTREDGPANEWYRRNRFEEAFRYVHVYLGPDDDPTGFSTPDGLSRPVTAFVHGRIENEADLRARYERVYVCRRYVRRVAEGVEIGPSP